MAVPVFPCGEPVLAVCSLHLDRSHELQGPSIQRCVCSVHKCDDGLLSHVFQSQAASGGGEGEGKHIHVFMT